MGRLEVCKSEELFSARSALRAGTQVGVNEVRDKGFKGCVHSVKEPLFRFGAHNARVGVCRLLSARNISREAPSLQAPILLRTLRWAVLDGVKDPFFYFKALVIRSHRFFFEDMSGRGRAGGNRQKSKRKKASAASAAASDLRDTAATLPRVYPRDLTAAIVVPILRRFHLQQPPPRLQRAPSPRLAQPTLQVWPPHLLLHALCKATAWRTSLQSACRRITSQCTT